jgi:hypothetical protein
VNFLEALGLCLFWFFFRFVFFMLITAVYHRHTRNCPHCYCRPVIRGLPTVNTTRLPPPSKAFAWRSADFRVYSCRFSALLSHDNWPVTTTEDALLAPIGGGDSRGTECAAAVEAVALHFKHCAKSVPNNAGL